MGTNTWSLQLGIRLHNTTKNKQKVANLCLPSINFNRSSTNWNKLTIIVTYFTKESEPDFAHFLISFFTLAYPANTMQFNERFESDLSTDLVKRETIPNATLSSSEQCCIKPGSLVEGILSLSHISHMFLLHFMLHWGQRYMWGPSRGEEEGENTKCNTVIIRTMLHSDGQPFYCLITCGGSHRNVSIHHQTVEGQPKHKHSDE